MRHVLTALLLLVCCSALAVAKEPYEGSTLISPLNSDDSFLIDMQYNVIKTWHGSNSPAALAYMLPDSSVLRPCLDAAGDFQHGGAGGHIERIDADDVVIWDYYFSTSDYQQHHDIEPMPNGNILVIAWELKTRQEAIDAGRETIPDDMWPLLIAEIEPVGATGGNIVWEWHIWDHLVQDVDPGKPGYGVIADHPELVNINYGGVALKSWIHANAIDYNPELDRIVVSSRKMNEIYIIDHSTTTAEAAGHTGGSSGKGGDILYRWGNPQVYDRGTEDDQYYWGVHGANWIDEGLPGAGNVLTLNNGDRLGSVNDYSSVEELVLPTDGGGNYVIDPGEPYGPAVPTWLYQNAPYFFSESIGGAYRLPNGNTIICEGTSGYIFEVDTAGATEWDYIAPANVHRAPRYWNSLVGVALPPDRPLLLSQNYPNPFNPFTIISFRLPAASQAKITIFDFRGRKVATLADGRFEPGTHAVEWHAREVASGRYFYRLQAGDKVETRSMTLLK